ncbi:MAG: hypothetical protein WCS42_04200 [Verrucomicrobiota bacterium]
MKISPQTDAAAVSRDAATGAEPRPGRLPVDVVEHIHRLVGGDAPMEQRVLDFIAVQWGAKNLLYVPPVAGREIIRRPGDFMAAVKRHAEPELWS